MVRATVLGLELGSIYQNPNPIPSEGMCRWGLCCSSGPTGPGTLQVKGLRDLRERRRLA